MVNFLREHGIWRKVFWPKSIINFTDDMSSWHSALVARKSCSTTIVVMISLNYNKTQNERRRTYQERLCRSGNAPYISYSITRTWQCLTVCLVMLKWSVSTFGNKRVRSSGESQWHNHQKLGKISNKLPCWTFRRTRRHINPRCNYTEVGDTRKVSKSS